MDQVGAFDLASNLGFCFITLQLRDDSAYRDNDVLLIDRLYENNDDGDSQCSNLNNHSNETT